MSIYEYDQEKHMRQEREASWEAGHKAGEKNKLISIVQKKLAKGHSISEIADALEEREENIKAIIEECEL